ncbi:hypothetical protein GCM10022243_03200 [Saccharothrix violaceirubra]
MSRGVGTVTAAPTGGAHPSADGLGAVRACAFLPNIDHAISGLAVRYDSTGARHAATSDHVRRGGEPHEVLAGHVEPVLALVSTLSVGPVFAMFNNAPGGFGLVEVGAAVQWVGLRLAEFGLGPWSAVPQTRRTCPGRRAQARGSARCADPGSPDVDLVRGVRVDARTV